jgi:hypothetical protein
MFYEKKRLHFYERLHYFVATSEVPRICAVCRHRRALFITTSGIRFQTYRKSFQKQRSHGTKFWPSFLERYKIGSAKLKTSYLSTYISVRCKETAKTAKGKANI